MSGLALSTKSSYRYVPTTIGVGAGVQVAILKRERIFFRYVVCVVPILSPCLNRSDPCFLYFMPLLFGSASCEKAAVAKRCSLRSTFCRRKNQSFEIRAVWKFMCWYDMTVLLLPRVVMSIFAKSIDEYTKRQSGSEDGNGLL